MDKHDEIVRSFQSIGLSNRALYACLRAGIETLDDLVCESLKAVHTKSVMETMGIKPTKANAFPYLVNAFGDPSKAGTQFPKLYKHGIGDNLLDEILDCVEKSGLLSQDGVTDE